MKNIITILIIIPFIINGQSFLQKGIDEYYKGNDSSAIKLLTLSIEKEEDSCFMAYTMRGAAHTMQNKYYLATLDFEKALELNSKSYLSHFYFGKLYLHKNLYLTAISYFDKSIELNSKSSKTFGYRAKAYMYIENYEKSKDDIDKSIALDSSNIDSYLTRGFLNIGLNNLEKAIKDFDFVINNKPNQKAFANKGLALYLKHEYTESILSYTQSLKLSTKDGEVLFMRGRSFLKINDNESACQDFKSSYELGYNNSYNMIKQYCFK